MRYEYIDPFVNSALRVLRTAVPGTARRGEITMLRADQIGEGVNVVIGITGESEGDIIISMEVGTALAISSRLLGSQTAALTDDALDVLGELGNMIAGNAVSALNDQGFDFNVMSPVVSVGGGKPSWCGDRETLQIPLSSGCGEMNMHVMLGVD